MSKTLLDLTTPTPNPDPARKKHEDWRNTLRAESNEVVERAWKQFAKDFNENAVFDRCAEAAKRGEFVAAFPLPESFTKLCIGPMQIYWSKLGWDVDVFEVTSGRYALQLRW